MLEAVGGLDEQITLIFETQSSNSNSWELRDSVTFNTMGFGFLINGSTGSFETPSLGGYIIPTVAPDVPDLPPEPVNMEDRLVAVQIEAPVAFLQLNTNPIAGFFLAPGHQWVVRREPENPGDPLPVPLYVSIDSFLDGHWPGFLAGEAGPDVGLTPRQAYFQLTVQDGMNCALRSRCCLPSIVLRLPWRL